MKGLTTLYDLQPILSFMLNRALSVRREVTAAEAYVDLLCMTDTPGSGESRDMPWVDPIPDLRKWVGPREKHELGVNSYTVTPDPYELSFLLKKEWMRWDKVGLLQPQINQAATRVQKHKRTILKDQITNALTYLGYDGKPLLATDHPIGASTGSNLDNSGADYPWILADCSWDIRPFCYFVESGPDWGNMNTDASEALYNRRELEWGVEIWEGACPCIWQMIYATDIDLTTDNIAAKTAIMMNRRNEQEFEYNFYPTHLFYDPLDWKAVKAALIGERDASGATNVVAGALTPVPIPNLNAILTLG